MRHARSYEFVVSLCTWPADDCVLKDPGNSWGAWSHPSVSVCCWKAQSSSLLLSGLVLYNLSPCHLPALHGQPDCVCGWVGVENMWGVYFWKPGVFGKDWGFAILTVSRGCQCWSQGGTLWTAQLLATVVTLVQHWNPPWSLQSHPEVGSPHWKYWLCVLAFCVATGT